MTETAKRILILVLTAGLFLAFNLSIFYGFTVRCLGGSEEFQAKSIAVSEYLPFAEETLVVKQKAPFTLTGDLPVLDGAAALYPVWSAFVYALYPEDSVSFDGEAFSASSVLQMNNTRGAYKAVVDGTADAVFCASPSEGQLAYAEEHGVELRFTPIGREAFVFVVNASNPVSSLTVDEIRGIYAGRYTSWAQLGGRNRRIAPLQRNEGSGSQTRFLSFMDGMEPVSDPFASVGSAIGFSFRYYVENLTRDEHAGGVKLLSVDGVYPSSEAVREGSYPLTDAFYLVTRADDGNPNIEILIDYILSPEGQQIIEASGYAGIS